ncbi:hypothetical protein HWV62_15333 [Athelia sp. TMB]|nr:hypothetical protein HWV62_15333 [Athelia sp. TMB]
MPSFEKRDAEEGYGMGLPTLSAVPSAMQQLRRQDHGRLQRTGSISITTGPERVNPGPKIVGDFRTLSIHVTDTKEGKSDYKGKKNVQDLSALEWHTLSSAEVCTRLGVVQNLGLDSPMAERRLHQNGKNVISPPPKNLAKKIFFYIFGGFGSLLFVASIICFLAWKPLGEPDPAVANLALAIVLLVVIAIQSFFNAWQDYSTGRVMASISGMLPTEILVFRDGNMRKMPAADLVSGDVVQITLGSKVPADIRLLDVSSDLRFDRSILTGESNPIGATVDATDPNFMESKNIALQGTLCTSGSGLGVCVGLGDGTVFGRIAKQASSERPARTTLEVEILHFVLIIAGMALCVAVLIVILWAAWLRVAHPGFINVPILLVDCVSVAVAFIPEGLPVCVTLSLTVIAGAMRKSNILCKSLATVESLGAVSVIASDKTGTLTQNKMTAVNVAFGGNMELSVKEATAVVEQGAPGSACIKSLAAVAGICNDAVFDVSSGEIPNEDTKVNGDATDTGLLKFSNAICSVTELRSQWREAGKVAFNSKNKFAIKLLQATGDVKAAALLPVLPADNFFQSDSLLLVKGAPDVLIRRCSWYMAADGSRNPLDQQTLASISATQESFASRGQRVLLLAKKIIPFAELDKEALLDQNSLEDRLISCNIDLTVLGLVALVDPPRDDTAHTVAVCRRAGIRFAMVTGDFAITAAAIAQQVGIITNPTSDIKHLADLPQDTPIAEVPEYNADKEQGDAVTSLVLSGSEMMTMTDSQWAQVLSFDEIVFARTSPQQKLQIVRMFQGAGCTVAVTGDGVNDAPALKQADVGVAVAGGSEVAMEAADLILLSNFSAIVTGIEYGRLCFENLRKSILYLLPAGSFSELMPVLLNVLFGLPQALSSIQMIIICVVTDVLPALSLVYERPEADLLLRKPRDRKKDRLADAKLICHAYFFIGILESLTAMTGAFYFGFQKNGVPFSALWLKYGNYDADPNLVAELTNKAQSIYFFNLVLMQWFNLLSTRTRKLSFFQQNPVGSVKTRNVYLFPAMICALGLACFFSYIPVFQKVFLTRGVAVEYFFLPMAYGCVVLFCDEMRKWWNRTHPKSIMAKIAW